MDLKPRIALLIDADNVSHEVAARALSAVQERGDVAIRRAYGNWFDSRLKRWEDFLRSSRTRSVQQFGYTKGKNATDMALTIDAMSLAYTNRPDAFAIVSSDADFAPLVVHLREMGLDVHGFGGASAPQPFRDVCTSFTLLDNGTKTPAPVRTPKDAAAILVKAVRAKADKHGWASVQAVRQGIGPKASFDPKAYGSSTLSKLLVATGQFEIRNEGTPASAVRIKATTLR